MRDRREGSRTTGGPWRSAMPWLAVVAFAIYAGAPFWTTTDAAFAGKLSSDNVVSMWFYDLVSRSLGAGRWPDLLTDLNHPTPWHRTKEFPAIMDAVVAAPLGWLLDFPHQWNATLGLAVLINGLGAAILARGAGAGGVGIVVAGCLGALCRPAWKDFVMARMNAVWIGLPAASLGLSLWALQMPRPGPGAALRRLPIAAAAGLIGALAATVYPPYLLLFAPAALVLGADPIRRSRGWALLPLVAAIGLGAAVAWPELSGMIAGRQGDFIRESCPDAYGALTADALWNSRPSAFHGLSMPGTAKFGWVLAPLVLLHRRRGAGLLLLGVSALWVLLSLGPCPAARAGLPLHPEAWPLIGPILPTLWTAGAPLHDYGRFAAVAVVLAGVLGGLGLDAIAGGRGGLRPLLALGAGAAVVGQVQFYVLSEAMDTRKWHPVSEPSVAADLRTHGPDAFPAAELPFDRRSQFLSAIHTPGPRINPLRPGDAPKVRQPFIEWLMGAGRGDLSHATPTAAEARSSGLRRVYFDRNRCLGGGVDRRACEPAVQATLESVLGPPEPLGDDLLVWVIER